MQHTPQLPKSWTCPVCAKVLMSPGRHPATHAIRPTKLLFETDNFDYFTNLQDAVDACDDGSWVDVYKFVERRQVCSVLTTKIIST